MSKGKYSPSLTSAHCARGYEAYCYNAYGKIPADWKAENAEYDTMLHFGDYDEEGFDSYGYSALDANGYYVGPGNGIDRWGYTEDQYLCMSDDEFESICIYGG